MCPTGEVLSNASGSVQEAKNSKTYICCEAPEKHLVFFIHRVQGSSGGDGIQKVVEAPEPVEMTNNTPFRVFESRIDVAQPGGTVVCWLILELASRE